jgi:hypothetical protein
MKLAGKRIKPLGFDWLADGKMALGELPARVQRFAFREFSQNPGLGKAEFLQKVGNEFFGDPAASQKVDDLLFIQEITNRDRTWSSSSPVVQPDLFKMKSEKWQVEHAEQYTKILKRLHEIVLRYVDKSGATEREMTKLAGYIEARWQAAGEPAVVGAGPSK